MRKWFPFAIILAAIFLDFIAFDIAGITGYAPDCLAAAFVALSLYYGIAPMALTALILGLVIDSVANPFVGGTSVFLALACVAGGCFRGKYYADNVIVPGFTAAGCIFIRENIMFLICKIMGRNIPGYGALLGSHILPSAILTGLVCAGIYALARAGRGKDTISG